MTILLLMILIFIGWQCGWFRIKYMVRNELNTVGSFFLKLGKVEITYKTPKFEPTHSERVGLQNPTLSIKGYRLFVELVER
jgi:hypothetical protein